MLLVLNEKINLMSFCGIEMPETEKSFIRCNCLYWSKTAFLRQLVYMFLRVGNSNSIALLLA